MRTVLLTALLGCGLCGCMTTQHVEQSRVVSTGVDTSGHYSCSSNCSQDVRQWHGPWFAQPESARP
jgi:hypothetical protein